MRAGNPTRLLHELLNKYGVERCRDNSCMFGSSGGMGTNGGCRCVERLDGRMTTAQKIFVQRLAAVCRDLAALAVGKEAPLGPA